MRLTDKAKRSGGFLHRVPAAARLLILMVALGQISANGQDPAASERSWPMFRGDPALTGIARSVLPNELAVQWTFEVEEPITSTAAIVDGVVFVGAMDEYFYALDLSSGKVMWKAKVGGAVQSSPLVVGALVVFGDEEGVIHALDRKTGKPRWSFVTDGQIISSANYHDGRIVVGSYDGGLYCLSADDGKRLWKHETEGYLHASPAVHGDVVVIAGCDEGLHVVGLADGKQKSDTTLGSVVGASAAIGDSRVYFGTYGSDVLCVDWKSGETVWRQREPEKEFPIMASAALTEKLVITAGRDKIVRALDRQKGDSVWTFMARARVDSSPVVVGDRVFIGSSDGNLYALDLNTGSKLWHFEAGSPISASPAVADGRLVIGTEDGVLYCFGARRKLKP